MADLMTIGYLYRDRRYEDDDDESVPDTNFDYDTETVDFDAPPVDQLPAEPEPLPPPTSAFSGVYAGEHQDDDDDDDELRQLSNRRGKVKCWVLIIFGLLAACALAVSLTFFLKPTNESIVAAAEAGSNPSSSSVSVPTAQPVQVSYPPTFRGTGTLLRTYSPTFVGTNGKITDSPSSTTTTTSSSDPPSSGNTTTNCTPGGVCSEQESTSCAVGTESCCGKTYDSLVCECFDGEWLCRNTDACMMPNCDDEVVTTTPTSNPTAAVTEATVKTEPPTLVTETPQSKPTPLPTKKPSSLAPTPSPSLYPSLSPSALPSKEPTMKPTTTSPTSKPTPQPTPSKSPTSGPTSSPTTVAPSKSPSNDPTSSPTKQPSNAPTTSSPTTAAPSKSPTNDPTSSPTKQPSKAPTTTDPTSSPTQSPTTLPTVSPSAVQIPTQGINDTEKKYCVNIVMTTDNYPKETGFSFLSPDGEVLFQQKKGSMKEQNTEYPANICDLEPGSYELVVEDDWGGQCCSDGEGKYVVDIDGRVILVGGRLRDKVVSHEIIVGFNPEMSDTDVAFHNAHNTRRKEFHESQGVLYRPMAWSPALAASALKWVTENAPTCTDTPETGNYGQNIASQRLSNPADFKPPVNAVGWWSDKYGADSTWPQNMKMTAVNWRSALYVGCASVITEIENSDPPRYCQLTNCRYARTPNCDANADNWLSSVLDDNAPDNAPPCGVLCPEADESGAIVEGACHA